MSDLTDRGLMTAEMHAALEVVATTRDASEVVAELRTVGTEQTNWQQARVRWLDQFAAQPIRTSQLATAWGNRQIALSHGIADSPGEITKWAAANALQVHVEKLRAQGATEGVPDDETLTQYQSVAQTLAAKYDVTTVLKAFNRYVAADKAGLLSRAQLAPGSAEVTVNGSVFTVAVLDKHDPQGFTIGLDTGCCMHLGTGAETCIWAGYEDQQYGFLAVYKDGRLRAQSLLYVNDSDPQAAGKLVADNIEANQGTDLAGLVEVYQQGISALIEKGTLRQDIQQVNVGTGYSDANLSELPVAVPIPSPQAKIYTDAHSQRILLAR